MTCKTCGKDAGVKSTGMARKFCNPACFKEWYSKISERQVDLDTHAITKTEREIRLTLFQQAKEGDQEAMRILKRKYGVTAIYNNGEGMIKL